MTDWGYRAAALMARRLPLRMSGTIADAIADLYVATHPAVARTVERRLRRLRRFASAEPSPLPGARDTYRAFARALLDFLRASDRDRAPCVELDDEARRILDLARSEATATLIVSGHFGPWEQALRWLASELGPLDALAAPHRSRAVERFFAGRRAASGVRTLNGGRSAASAALARLRAGGRLAALADRGCRPRRHVTGLEGFVPIDRAPLLLASRAGARVLAGVSWRGVNGALHVRFLEPFSLAPHRGGLSLPQAAARLQRFFDEHVLAHPAQWYEWTAPPLAEGGREAGA
ncbi:MAG: hypothetical protein AABZ94_08185 [Candidatus Eisenbacteria bacterium]